MSRNSGVARIEKIEYVQYYNELVKKYSDPTECLFKIMHSARKISYKLQAATTLISWNSD